MISRVIKIVNFRSSSHHPKDNCSAVITARAQWATGSLNVTLAHHFMVLLFTSSSEEESHVFESVCLSFCMKKLRTGFDEIICKGWACLRRKWLDFGVGPASLVDSVSVFVLRY